MPNMIGYINHIQYHDLRSFNGRIFVVSDIHGHYDILNEALSSVSFDKSCDKLFSCGDWTDRGPYSEFVLDYLSEPWIHSIQGNHEQMFIDASESGLDENNRSVLTLLQNGGVWAFMIDEKHEKTIYEMFKSLPLAMQLDTKWGSVGLVHAEVPFNDWNEFKQITQAEYDWNGIAVLQWARNRYKSKSEKIIPGIDLVISGHTPTSDGEVQLLGNQLFIDGGVYFRDNVNLVEINQEFMEKYKCQ